MTETRVLRAMAALTREVMEAAVADIAPEESLRNPVPQVNGMNWVLGHVTHVNAAVLELLGVTGDPTSDALRRYAPGSPPVRGADDALDFEVLREALLRQGPLLDRALSEADPERLASPPPAGFDGELRDFLHFIAFHQAYHAGQAALLRRALGYDRAFG
jgi:uncharacterized damage-inducible protein DinB